MKWAQPENRLIFLIIASARHLSRILQLQKVWARCSNKTNGRRGIKSSSRSLSLNLPRAYCNIIIAQKMQIKYPRQRRRERVESNEAPWGHWRDHSDKTWPVNYEERLLPGEFAARENIHDREKKGRNSQFCMSAEFWLRWVCGFLRFYEFVFHPFVDTCERARVVFFVYGLSNIRSTFCTRGPLKVRSLQFSSRKLDKKCTWNCRLDGFQQIESKWPVLFFKVHGGTANSCFIKFLTLNWEILIFSCQKLCLWINLCSLSCKFIVKFLLKYCYGMPG